MLRLSKKADYALMAMKHLALRGDCASSSAREIAEQYDIPIELLAKVLQRLVRRGLDGERPRPARVVRGGVLHAGSRAQTRVGLRRASAADPKRATRLNLQDLGHQRRP